MDGKLSGQVKKQKKLHDRVKNQRAYSCTVQVPMHCVDYDYRQIKYRKYATNARTG